MFFFLLWVGAQRSPGPRVTVELPAGPVRDGRLLLLLSNDPAAEPRFQINDGPTSQMAFGVDIENAQPGARLTVDATASAWPVRSLADVPPGDYFVQAVFDVYETFRRASGPVVKLPMDRGEGRQWNLAPGNLYSKPVKLRVDAAAQLTLKLDQTIPPPPKRSYSRKSATPSKDTDPVPYRKRKRPETSGKGGTTGF